MTDGWISEPLSEIADILMGQSPPSSTYNREGNGLPFFQGKAEFGEMYPTVVKYCSKPLRVAEPNDILMTVRAPVGPVNLSPSKCCIGRGLCAIRGKKHKIDQVYLFYYLRLIESKLSALGQGSTFAAIGRRDLEGIEVPHPTALDLQRRIASILQKAHTLRGKRDQANQLTNKIIQSVLLKMFGDPAENPNDWPVRKLEELTERITKGESPKWQGFDYVTDGPLFVRSEDINWGFLDLTRAARIPKEFHRKLERSQLRAKDVLINITGVSIGRAAEVPGNIGEANVSQNVAVITPSEGLDSTYLVHFLTCNSVQDMIERDKRGVARDAISLGDLRRLAVLCPPRNLQAKFASIVRKLQRMIDSQLQSTQEINELFHSLMQKAFRGELVS
jgi:type I restriction enzyme S subunit